MLHVSGVINNRSHAFLLDSGASHNFLPLTFCNKYKLDTTTGTRVHVRMADNRVVHTNLYCSVFVKFAENIGGLIQFTVLDADVPMILGLPFLKRFNPLINW